MSPTAPFAEYPVEFQHAALAEALTHSEENRMSGDDRDAFALKYLRDSVANLVRVFDIIVRDAQCATAVLAYTNEQQGYAMCVHVKHLDSLEGEARRNSIQNLSTWELDWLRANCPTPPPKPKPKPKAIRP